MVPSSCKREIASSQPKRTGQDAQLPHTYSIGLFTHPNGGSKRQLIRTLFKPDLDVKGHRIDFKFIFGRPPNDEWTFALEQEQCVLFLCIMKSD